MNATGVSNNTVDVKLFFAEITQGYSELTTVIRNFSKNLHSYSSQQISHKCNVIQSKRDNLSLLDEELLNIIELTGSEIQNEPFVNAYRIAFNDAISACNDLFTHLQLTKAELLSPQVSVQPH